MRLLRIVHNRWQMFYGGLRSMDFKGFDASWSWRFGPWIDWTPPTPEHGMAIFHFDRMGLGFGPVSLLWVDTN